MTTEYLTADDIVQHLGLRHGLLLYRHPLAQATTAAREGYRRLFSLHDWNYFKRFEMVNVQAPYSTGTIAYTHSTRTVTLTSGTWPTAAAYGDLRISQVRYQVLYRNSDTEIVLPETSNPGEDVASGTSYEWTQHRYPLNFQVGDITEILDPQHPNPLTQIDMRGAMFLQDSFSTQTFPTTYTLFPSQHLPGTWDVWLPSAVYADRKVRIMYDARHTPLDVRYVSGDSLAVNGQVATFPASTLTSAHVGCVLRISSNSEEPTTHVGRQNDSSYEWELHPYAYERIIVAVSGDTAILSEEVPGGAISGRGWSMSTLVDSDSGPMRTLILRLAEAEYAKVAHTGVQESMSAEQLMRPALIEAQVVDGYKLKPRPNYIPAWYAYRLADLNAEVA